MKTMCPPSYHHNAFVATHAQAHDVRLHIAGTDETKSAQQAHLASMKFEPCVCHGSFMSTYKYI